eukprot:scaffold90468_cov31-Attheya_sp.AAC.2
MIVHIYLTKSSTFPAKKCKTNDPLHSNLVLKPKSDHAHLHAHDTISVRLRLAITTVFRTLVQVVREGPFPLPEGGFPPSGMEIALQA